jgi:hypothetical protein
MENSIEKYEAKDEKILSVKEVKAQINVIQEIMNSVMQNGHHYGVVPGCGSKPTLLKAGSEKLAFAFRLKIKPRIEIKEFEGGHRNYRIVTDIYNRHGTYVGSGVGEASTTEEKYQWRVAVCDEEYDATTETDRRLKYKKSYGKIEKIKQVKTNPADIYNTVLKIAKKRSTVDGVLTVLAASDIFTQDIEDISDDDESQKPTKSDTVKETKVRGGQSGVNTLNEGGVETMIPPSLAQPTTVEGEKKQEVTPKPPDPQITTPSTVPPESAEKPKPQLKATQLIQLMKTCKNAAGIDRAWSQYFSNLYTETEKNMLFDWKDKLKGELK